MVKIGRLFFVGTSFGWVDCVRRSSESYLASCIIKAEDGLCISGEEDKPKGREETGDTAKYASMVCSSVAIYLEWIYAKPAANEQSPAAPGVSVRPLYPAAHLFMSLELLIWWDACLAAARPTFLVLLASAPPRKVCSGLFIQPRSFYPPAGLHSSFRPAKIYALSYSFVSYFSSTSSYQAQRLSTLIVFWVWGPDIEFSLRHFL